MTLRINLLTVVFVAGLIALAAALGRSPTSESVLAQVPETPTATATATAGPATPTATAVAPTATTAPTQAPATATATAAPTATATPDPNAPKASLIVKLVSGVTTAQRADVIERNGGTELSYLAPLRLATVQVLAADVDEAFASFDADPLVQRVEVDQKRAADAIPSDLEYASQWALPLIGWDLLFGEVDPAGTAKIAVLDTGVKATHPDLAGKVLTGFSAFPNSDPRTDTNGHGTALASIAAANTNNNTGIAGVAYDGVSIIPVQVLDTAGLGQDSDIIDGVIFAVDAGADVILMAFSNPGYSESLQEAIDYAWDSGVVVVAAAGNDGSSAPHYPAGHSKVVGVASTDSTDTLASNSNSGIAVFLSAPGVGIIAADDDGGTTTISGTSAAAAHVAGAAALLRAYDPSASNATIVGRLARNADPATPADTTGNGRLNLARALETPRPPA